MFCQGASAEDGGHFNCNAVCVVGAFVIAFQLAWVTQLDLASGSAPLLRLRPANCGATD